LTAPAPTETAEVITPAPSEAAEVIAPAPSNRALVASETTEETKPGTTEVVEVTLVTMIVRPKVGAGAASDVVGVVGLPPPRIGKAGVITGIAGTLKLKLLVGITMGEVAPSRSEVASLTMFDAAALASVAADARSEVASLNTEEMNDVGRIEVVTDPRSDVAESTAEVNAPVPDGLKMEVASLRIDETIDVGRMEVVTDPRSDVTDPRSDAAESTAEVNAPVAVGPAIEVVSVSIAPASEVTALATEVKGSEGLLDVPLVDEDVVPLADEDVPLAKDGTMLVGSTITLKLDVVATELVEGTATETEMTTNGVDELLLELETADDDVVGTGITMTGIELVINDVVGTGATTMGVDKLEVAAELEEDLVLELDTDEVL